MKKTNALFLFLLLALLPDFAPAQEKARDFYKRGDFGDALDAYTALLSSDTANPGLLYDVGNCYFKTGDQAAALSAYLKAFKLMPRDPDIRYNLDFAAKQTGQTLFSPDIPRFFYSLYFLFSDSELKGLSFIFLWSALLLSAIFFYGKLGEKPGALAVFCFLFSAAFLVWGFVRKNSVFYSPGVVMNEGARLLSGPGENFKVSASLPKTKIVKVLGDSDENFVETGLIQEGIKGWMKRSDLALINPEGK